MSGPFGRIAAGAGRRGRRWGRRPLRWLATGALAVLGFLVFVPGTDDNLATDNIWLSSAFPIWLLAATWRIWRAPERDLPEGLRWRSRHRRVCWRASVLLLFGSCFALISCAYWEWRRDGDDAYSRYAHFDHLASVSGTTAVWLLLLSPLPGLLDFPLWRVWPAPVRRAHTVGRVAEELMKPSRYRFLAARQIPAPGFDPDRGWSGRPMPVFERLPKGRTGAPLTVRPRTLRKTKGRTVLASTDRPSLAWDGEELTLTGADGLSTTVPIGRAAELVEVREDFGGGYETVLLLLDADGRWTATMSEPGFLQQDLAALAGAAGIPFARYELGRSEGRTGSLRPRLFPAAPGKTVRLGAGLRVTPPLR